MSKASEAERLDALYMEGAARALSEYGSVLMTSSRFLNSAEMRDVYAQEGLRRNGDDVPSTYMVHRAMKAIDQLTDIEEIDRLVAAERLRNPAFAAWLDERVLTDLNVNELAEYPADTLGGIIHEYLSRTGYELNFAHRGMEPKTDYDFIRKQQSLGHDIEHMVSGFEPDPIGEFALIACNLGAFYRHFSPELACELGRMPGYLLSTGLMKINLHYPRVASALWEGIRMGFEQSEQINRPLFMTNWRDRLSCSIADIREDLGIKNSPPPGQWRWTFQERRG